MGAIWSLPYRKAPAAANGEFGDNRSTSYKRLKMSPCDGDDVQRLIPGLPDEISNQIIARIPRSRYLALQAVSRGWRDAVTGAEVYKIRKEVGKTDEWLYLLTRTSEEDNLLWHGFDPNSGTWQRLPPMPNVVHEEEPSKGLWAGLQLWNLVNTTVMFVNGIKRWLGGKTALRQPHLCGFAIGSVDGCLYVLGGFSRASAIRCVWKYDPRINSWEEASSMSTARAYCKTGLLNNKLYVVGGVSRSRDGLTPLQSAEVFDPCTGEWDAVPSMPCLKAQGLPAPFLAEVLKPIATGMTSYRGKLCVPQSLYSWPFFVDVGGEIYDPETTSWVEMPAGMGEGWPTKQAGTKLSVVVGGELYALEPSSSLDGGKIKVYAPDEDVWKVVIDKVPVLDFTYSECPYLLAAFMGKLHVITKDGRGNMVIAQAELPNKTTSSPLPSSSASTSSSAGSSVDNITENLPVQANSDIWKVIATKNFGVSEFISCQVLDL